MSEERKVSAVETIKEKSNYLRIPIDTELPEASDHFGKDSETLLKFHGTYQQDDRDAREIVCREGTGGKDDKKFIFMVRTKIPGGKLTSQQLLAELDLCDELGSATLRCTSRQGLQLHGILKKDLKRTIARINEVQLTTLGACGDVNRNVMCCPAPYKRNTYQQIQELTDQIAAHLAPRTSSYHDLWLTDITTGAKTRAHGTDSVAREEVAREEVAREEEAREVEVEPIYGKLYMPRKFKIAVGFPGDNCVDIYTNDLGLLAITQGDEVTGYNVIVGGGLGVTPSAKKTFPALGHRMAFVTPDRAMDVVTAVVKLQRDFGNREDRKLARLKYVVANWGLAKFKAKVEEYYGGTLAGPTEDDVYGFNDHLGWDEQGDGRWFYGLNIENGRLKDTTEIRLKSAIRKICENYAPGIRLTSHQSILFTDIQDGDRSGLESILRRHGVPLSSEISAVRRWSMACVAWPTCGLSITEAERALPGMIDLMEQELAKLGLSNEKFTVRMTGCPNGCVRPYNSDIGLVGKTKGKYTILVGGRLLGNRLNFIFKDLVPEEDVVKSLVPLFTYFKQDRQEGETLGDFCHRKGLADLLAWTDQYLASTAA